MLTWELLGAAVGAGLASGREIAAFFGRFGAWGYAGIALAAGTMRLLAGAMLPDAWRGRWPERLWRAVSAMLLAATGGAMLAGAGELAAMACPALRIPGMAGMLLISRMLARGRGAGLAWTGRALLAALLLLLALTLRRPPMAAAWQAEGTLPQALLHGAAYGGFNAALLQPLMRQRNDASGGRALTGACALLAGLLAAGTAVLLRHSGAMASAMPLLQLAGTLGAAGRALAAVCLMLAMLSTLSSCLRSLGNTAAGLAGVIAVSALGFSGAVDAAYPLLGAACAALLTAMWLSNFANSRRGPFQSGQGVV